MTTPRWYMVNKMGMATLCASKADAEKEAADAQRFWPHMGPHRAVQLVEAADVEAMRAGYDAARLEIESLQARIKTMAEEHADELMVAHLDGRMCGRSTEPTGEYPLLPEHVGKVEVSTTLENSGLRRHKASPAYTSDQRRAYVDRAMRAEQPATAQQPSAVYAVLPTLFREALAWGMTYGPEIPAHQWDEMRESMVKQYTDRASHGQAPAQAAPQQEDQEPVAWYVTGCGRLLDEDEAKAEARHIGGTAMAIPVYTAPQPSPTAQGDALDAAFKAVCKRLCKLPRYSFALDSRSNLRRCEDKSGNWIEFDAVHALFDPVAIDASLAAQEGK